MSNEERSLKQEVKFLKAIADECRIKIIQSLANGEQCVCDVVHSCCGRAQPTVSLHLRVLEDAGILESKKERTFKHYKIANPLVLEILKLMHLIDIPSKETKMGESDI